MTFANNWAGTKNRTTHALICGICLFTHAISTVRIQKPPSHFYHIVAMLPKPVVKTPTALTKIVGSTVQRQIVNDPSRTVNEHLLMSLFANKLFGSAHPGQPAQRLQFIRSGEKTHTFTLAHWPILFSRCDMTWMYGITATLLWFVEEWVALVICGDLRFNRPSATLTRTCVGYPAFLRRRICSEKLLVMSSEQDLHEVLDRHNFATPLFTSFECADAYGSSGLLARGSYFQYIRLSQNKNLMSRKRKLPSDHLRRNKTVL